MKNYRLLTFVLLFTGFLLQGFWFGRKVGNQIQVTQNADHDQSNIIYSPNNAPNNIPKDPSNNVLTPPVPSSAHNGHEQIIHQRNLLVIGVDDLETKSPSLQSVWLIIFMPNTPHFMLLPIYPNGSFVEDKQFSMADPLPETFLLDKRKAPRESFFKGLEVKEIWWNAYILLDETALIEVSNFIGRISETSSTNIIKIVPDADDDPIGSLLGQAEFVQSLCRQTTTISNVDTQQYLDLLSKVRGHIISDIDFDTTITEWQELITNSGNISCEFPSLALPNFEP